MANLLLKWGTVKGWDDISDADVKIIEEYYKDGMPMGCAQDRPDAERREILCKLIDQFEGEIHNDWTGKYMTKEEAKKYIREYK